MGDDYEDSFRGNSFSRGTSGRTTAFGGTSGRSSRRRFTWTFSRRMDGNPVVPAKRKYGRVDRKIYPVHLNGAKDSHRFVLEEEAKVFLVVFLVDGRETESCSERAVDAPACGLPCPSERSIVSSLNDRSF